MVPDREKANDKKTSEHRENSSPQSGGGLEISHHQLHGLIGNQKIQQHLAESHSLELFTSDSNRKEMYQSNVARETRDFEVRNTMQVRIARSVEDWVTSSVNIEAMSYTDLLGEIDELSEWLERQIQSSDETMRIENTLATLRREAAKREQQTLRRRRRRRRRRQERQQSEPSEIRRPRILIERTSIQYEDNQEMRAEFDLIMEWLARDGLSSEDREILESERESLSPMLLESRRRDIVARRTERLRTALSADERDAANSLVQFAQTIERIYQDPQNSQISYLLDNNEMITISTSQADRLRNDLLNQLQRAHLRLRISVNSAWDRYQAQREINDDTILIDDIAAWLGNVEDPILELLTRRARAMTSLQLLEIKARSGRLAEAARILPELERNSQIMNALSRAFVQGLIEGAGTAVGILEFTRDASFAIAGSIAAVVAAPVVAGGVAGLGITGTVTAGAATTIGTGVVVGTGTAAVRGSSAALGHGLAGSTREDIAEVFLNEFSQGFRDGLITGAAGGAARVLGPALGVGTNLSGQALRRISAEAIVNGTSSMIDTLMRGGSIRDAVAAGIREAALSVPGALVGGANNRLTRELGGPLTAGATAYVGAIASGASPEEAMASAGVAVTSNITMSRATHSRQADAALEARGRRIGERTRHEVSATGRDIGRRTRRTVAAIMIGTADPLPTHVPSGAVSITESRISGRRQAEGSVNSQHVTNRSQRTSTPRSTRRDSRGDARSARRTQTVDLETMSPQHRREYESSYPQYRQEAERAYRSGRRPTPPLSREDYVRFRHGVATGQITPRRARSSAGAINEVLRNATDPEAAFGFSQTQRNAAGHVLGRPMTSPEIGELGTIWRNVANDGEVMTLTRENSRRLFDNHRNRFWRAVRRSPSAVAFFENMGFTFPDSPSTAPIRILSDGQTMQITIDHIAERQTAPTLALDPDNLRFSTGRENSVLLRLLHEMDPFQRR